MAKKAAAPKGGPVKRQIKAKGVTQVNPRERVLVMRNNRMRFEWRERA